MDCCGMPMESWPGGGLVCRRCQAKVGVPWGRDRNPFARCVEGAVTEEMAAAALPDQVEWNIPPKFRVDEAARREAEIGPILAPATSGTVDHVEQVKSSGIGRLGRKGGPK